MTIRIVCENETGYDAASGTFNYCDHTLTCDDSLLAKVTKCPKCMNPIRVGSSRRHVWLETGQPVADAHAVSHQAIQQAQKRVPSPLDTPEPEKKKPVVARRRPKRVQVAICPSCGTSVSEAQPRCPACRAEIVRPKGLSTSSLKISRPVGFHRWVLKTVFSGVNPSIVAWTLHGSILLLGLATVSVAFISFDPPVATGWLIAVMVVWCCYAYIYFCCYRACTDLSFSLRWWQRIFWNMLLRSGRKKNWVVDATDGRERPVLDLREERISDELLMQNDRLTTCEVLDLENCPISDQGAQALHFLKDLRCLIIRGTAITSKERARLQVSLPMCWIWY